MLPGLNWKSNKFCWSRHIKTEYIKRRHIKTSFKIDVWFGYDARIVKLLKIILREQDMFEKAKKLGVKILSETEFLKLIK